MNERLRIEQLFSKNGHRILRYINSLINSNLRHHISPEDILNEAVRYALERPEQWRRRSEEDLFVYFLWKAKLLVIDKARHFQVAAKPGPLRSISSLQPSTGGCNVEPSPTFVLHRRAKRSALQNYLKLLPNADHREAIRLVRIEGFSLAEAAAAMGRSPEAVRKLVQRGFESLVHTARAAGVRKFETSGETT